MSTDAQSVRNESEPNKKTRTIWNYQPNLPIENSPLFAWPPNFGKIGHWVRSSYLSFSIRVFTIIVAAISFTYFTPNLEIMKILALNWIILLYARNLALMLILAGGLHLYFYSYKKQGSKLKFDPRDMAKDVEVFKFKNQVWDNMYYSIAYGVTFWTLLEVAVLWWLGNGYVHVATWADNPVWFVAVILLIPIWHSFHFYWVHRFLHWAPIYKMVHSVHHKNINIGPWSGMSMHPIESFFYLTSILIHLVIPTSPFHVVYHLMFLVFNAVIAHSGFEALLVKDKSAMKMGRFHHQLHHKFFTCNYGNAEMPWDAWFGSFHDGTPEAHERIFGRRI